MLARLGGDEFGVLLEDTGADAAQTLADRLDAVLDDGQTASLGVAVWDGLENADALIARADAAMYDRKRARRGELGTRA
jgi:GGDEF domain-containing protein